MMKGSASLNQYLVCSADEPIGRSFGYLVEAATETDALHTYLRQVYAKEEVFRESVLDRAVNMSFAERFYLATPQENYRFNETALTSVTDEVVATRVRQFFADQPEFGEAFLAYMADADTTRITDEIFEYIAVNSGDGAHVLELASIPKLEAGK
ncbi:hypothetical protein LJR296_008010 [Cupriavidus necator]|uniref:hypothetical protein n=1 Tax=Cupriavidus necator TaxID=106590 RepID=UPI003ECEB830